MFTKMTALHTVLAFAGLLMAGAMVLAQDPAGHAEHKQQPASPEQTKGGCQQMMQMREKMMQAEKQMDQQLQQKLQAMDKAQGQAKVDAMAEVIRELVQQRQQMHQQRQQMMQAMMQHMGQHMQTGMQGGGKQAMMDCPMMKAQPGQPSAPGGHEAHH